MTVLKKERDRISCQLVIGIEKEQEVSLAALKSEVSGCGDASVVSCQDGTRNGIWQVVMHDARSAVFRAIINHDHLQLTVVLRSDEPCDRFQSSRQRRFGVVGGNENAQQRRIGRTGSVWSTSSRRRMVHGPLLLKKVAVICHSEEFSVTVADERPVSNSMRLIFDVDRLPRRNPGRYFYPCSSFFSVS